MKQKAELIGRDAQDTTSGRPRSYRHSHGFGGSATLTATLVHAVADDIGLDIVEAERLVHNAVDTDALDRLYRPGPDGAERTNGQTSFTVDGHVVTVYGTGQITVRPPK